MILSICSGPEILKVMRIVKIAIMCIRIAVPVLLLLIGCKTFMSAITSNEEINKPLSKLVIMCISAICVFFVPTFVNLILSLTNSDIGDCLENATPEGISNAYYHSSSKYLSNAKNSLNESSYNLAKNYINNVDDEGQRDELLEELSIIKGYIDIKEEMNSITSKNFSQKVKSIEEEINDIEDEEIKEKLFDILEAAKEKIYKTVGNYPIVPFDEIDQYKNLTYMSNIKLSDMLLEHNTNIDELNEKIKTAVEIAGVGTREATVAAAITLIGNIADCGYRLPYFWGGKRSDFGADGTWGPKRSNSFCNDHYFDNQKDLDHCNNDMSNWGMDCSGFVNWAVVNGTQQKKGQGETNNGTNVSLNSSTANKAVCQIGDALGTTGHIVLVVGLDDEKGRYIIAEESSGLEIRSVNYDGTRSGTSKKYYCIKLDHNYVN